MLRHSLIKQSWMAVGLLMVVLTFSASTNSCSKEQVVYQRPVAELNQKAKQLMNDGQAQAAVGRLEAALDLLPGEPTTLNNLAVAYQQNRQYQKSLALFEDLLKTGKADKATMIKNMGIVHEAMADELMIQSEEEPEPPPKLSKEDVKQLESKAIDHYKLALQYYSEAIDGSKNPGPLQFQVATLKERIKQIQEGKQAEVLR